MKRMSFVFLALIALALSGCGVSKTVELELDGPAAEAKKLHPAAEVANKVLDAIHAEDVDALKSYFNVTNREQIGDEQFAELFDVARDMAGDVRKVSELRNDVEPEVILAKIRVVAEEVYLLVLEPENGEYRLEDIDTLLLQDYEKMAIVR